MSASGTPAFSGSVAEVYQRDLVPLIFEPYAIDLAARVASRPVRRVLELACGTGVATRAMAARLAPDVAIVATDLSPVMLSVAESLGAPRDIEWRTADASSLPFADGSFDVVVCQFGAMFFPDKGRTFAEVRRVLSDGGAFLFNVWDRIEENELADEITRAMVAEFPNDPPNFLARLPHAYHRPFEIAADLAAGGFKGMPTIETIAVRSRAASAEVVAVAYCQGTPLRGELEARAPGRLDELSEIALRAVTRRFGQGPIESKLQAHVISVDR